MLTDSATLLSSVAVLQYNLADFYIIAVYMFATAFLLIRLSVDYIIISTFFYDEKRQKWNLKKLYLVEKYSIVYGLRIKNEAFYVCQYVNTSVWDKWLCILS